MDRAIGTPPPADGSGRTDRMRWPMNVSILLAILAAIFLDVARGGAAGFPPAVKAAAFTNRFPEFPNPFPGWSGASPFDAKGLPRWTNRVPQWTNRLAGANPSAFTNRAPWTNRFAWHTNAWWTNFARLTNTRPPMWTNRQARTIPPPPALSVERGAWPELRTLYAPRSDAPTLRLTAPSAQTRPTNAITSRWTE